MRVGRFAGWACLTLLVAAGIQLRPKSQVAVSIKTIKANADQYDNKAVSVTGTISDYKEKVSKRGNDYTTFTLNDGTGELTVYSRKHLGLSNGKKVKVEGFFTKVKQVSGYTFYNEIEAESVQALEK